MLNRFICRGLHHHSIRCVSGGVTQVPPKLNELNHNMLTIEQTATPKQKSPYDQLKFGKEFSDHMLDINWTNDYGWQDPAIHPYASFAIDPAASCLHYALEAFEGMKAYIDDNDRIRLFRPELNVQRMNSSCEALFFPTFDGDEFLQCLFELLKVERSWIPKKHGFSLYLRPTVISTHPFIGVAAAESVKLYVICSPVGPYYPEGFKPVSLLASDKYVRAWPGGVGNKKLGSNYGPTIRPQHEAASLGYTQIMWLFPDRQNDDYFVSEVGTMNQFFFWKNKDGEQELITAPLDGTILPGVTRDSILTLVRDWGRFKVTERPFTMSEVIEAIEEDRMLESFGAGTAAIVSPVNRIGWKGKDYAIPLDREDPNANAGPLATELFNTILDIQYGKKEYKNWSVIVPEK
mmetsp:Transcript_37170/g.61134  ORF Transcript_37170/g.61134 Transcript_37170/m.61134 type:complete len:405 (-) Transcript_37170:148-1362(-)|eukprot:CAMPEP_0202688118 /NCGR_PEP_ID=MMETSP1385-20130828/3657_1 /ASSEMBLY_ACC=CAM_ASM_000861 /TAXON_ID=933848 /ORGANISM="Elphidium margaritaceum" /LENGTH=404 /DNA_ID=CAMNT_0049343015 /DNA_START=43 /DNA_END=1257 /DNA_ORIENTATION=+